MFENFVHFANICVLPCWSDFDFFLSFMSVALKAKIKLMCFLHSYCCYGNLCILKMITLCSPMIGQLFDAVM